MRRFSLGGRTKPRILPPFSVGALLSPRVVIFGPILQSEVGMIPRQVYVTTDFFATPLHGSGNIGSVGGAAKG